MTMILQGMDGIMKESKRSPKRRAQQIRWQRKNRERINNESKIRARRNFLLWSGIIPNKAVCGVCGKDIYLNTERSSVICFDHRRGGLEPITINPSSWLISNRPTEENIKIWNQSDFGTLCVRCNALLPTKNRIEFLRAAMAYATK